MTIIPSQDTDGLRHLYQTFLQTLCSIVISVPEDSTSKNSINMAAGSGCKQPSGHREPGGLLPEPLKGEIARSSQKNKDYSAGNNNSHARPCRMPTMLWHKYSKVKISWRS